MTSGGTKSDPEKVRTIKEFPEPKNLFSLRTFLGLASNYRSLVKNQPLTAILKRENGTVNKGMSKKEAIKFYETHSTTFVISWHQKMSYWHTPILSYRMT